MVKAQFQDILIEFLYDGQIYPQREFAFCFKLSIGLQDLAAISVIAYGTIMNARNPRPMIVFESLLQEFMICEMPYTGIFRNTKIWADSSRSSPVGSPLLSL